MRLKDILCTQVIEEYLYTRARKLLCRRGGKEPLCIWSYRPPPYLKIDARLSKLSTTFLNASHITKSREVNENWTNLCNFILLYFIFRGRLDILVVAGSPTVVVYIICSLNNTTNNNTSIRSESITPDPAVYSTWRLNECRARMPFCRPISEQLEAPLVVIGVGSSLAVVGTVPVVITLSLGINTSATIIGVGFIGFGFLIILPGICWCLVSHLSYSYRFWRHPATTRTCADLEEALVLRSVTQYSLIIAHRHRSIRFVPRNKE